MLLLLFQESYQTLFWLIQEQSEVLKLQIAKPRNLVSAWIIVIDFDYEISHFETYETSIQWHNAYLLG